MQTHADALRQASEIWGVQEEYWDIFGVRHVTSADVQRAVLKAIGIPADDEKALRAAIEAEIEAQWSDPVRTTVVAGLHDGLPVSVPSDYLSGEVRAELEWENGASQILVHKCAALRDDGEITLRALHFVRKQFPLPDGAPLGYHKLHVEIVAPGQPSRTASSRLILCPDRAYRPDFLHQGGKAAGVAVSLYSLRSHRNWGCGDFSDLQHLTDWIAEEVHADFIALNPLHSIPNRQPYNTSPYLPNSSYYRNPIYLDVERIEHVQRCALAQRLLASAPVQMRFAELRSAPFVEYEKVYNLKLRFLKLGFRQFLRTKREPSGFTRFVEEEGELLDKYAVYCALEEVLHKRDRNVWIWPDWPEAYRNPHSSATTDFAQKHWRLVLFYKYMQWQLDIQLAEAQRYAIERGLRIGLYHDLALATDRCGSDLWAHRDFYIAGCRVGSPPDDFSPSGQDWAFPPPNSLRHRENGYRHFADSIRKNAKHGGALRIDHVMRFFRLFWIPDGKDAHSGVYVREFADDLIRILALESVRNRVIVIGEDLGTVEPYIRDALSRFGILSYRLLYFEKRPDGMFRTSDEYPRESLVSVSTHDLPTLAGFWNNRDIVARRDAGVLPDQASFEAQVRDRALEKQKLLNLFWRSNLLPPGFPRQAPEILEFTGELHNAAVGFLALTQAELMVLNQEDLFKDGDQQNLPGTTEQYPNWRHKMRFQIEELRSENLARNSTAMFRTWLERTGRSR